MMPFVTLKEQKIEKILPKKLKNHVVDIVFDCDGIWVYFDSFVGDIDNDFCHTLHADNMTELKCDLKSFKPYDSREAELYFQHNSKM